MEKKKNISKGIIIISLIIVILVVAIVIGAFVIHDNKPFDVVEETLEGGKISLTYSDEQNLFLIEGAIPTSDVVGKAADSADLFFDFTVKTILEEANSIDYSIVLVKDETLSTAINKNIKVYLEKEKNGTFVSVVEPVIFSNNFKSNELGSTLMNIYKSSKTANGSDNYRLRMWLSDTAVYSSEQLQNFGVKIAIVGNAK